MVRRLAVFTWSVQYELHRWTAFVKKSFKSIALFFERDNLIVLRYLFSLVCDNPLLQIRIYRLKVHNILSNPRIRRLEKDFEAMARRL